MRTAGLFVFLGVLSFSLSVCGIEDYPFLSPIPSGNIQRELNSSVTVYIPGDYLASIYFTQFTVFYRIYVSDINEVTPAKSNLSNINQALYNDYTAIEPYIANDSTGSASISTLFSNRKFYSIEVNNADIDSLLSVSVRGHTVIFDFSQTPGSIPALVIGSSRYELIRSRGNGNFNPIPADRYFINDPDLYASGNINPNVNADVTDKTDTAGNSVIDPSAVHHTYVCMYIVAAGLDLQTFSPLYSTPAFVGILRLPDPS
jgi:hypothetical protein